METIGVIRAHSGYRPDWLALAMWYIRNSFWGVCSNKKREAFNTGRSTDAQIDWVPLYRGSKERKVMVMKC